ncbi:MAG: dihydropteroate synthase [Synergistaceae bacterium]|jgi:dihydropteroate synthase|nr:dihydropteroate synthase [Synergistaceae bacterium]
MSAVVYPLNIRSARELAAALDRLGADPRSNAYLQPKRCVRHFFIKQADFRAAAYMKQEMLARGGDAAVAKHVIDGKVQHSDVLLMGTDGQLSAFLQKMEAMDCWGLREVRDALAEALRGAPTWVLPLPGGRELRLGGETKIMGILNLTDDSFHAASRVKSLDDLLERAAVMLRDGADVLDLGAESTRPGSKPLPEKEELARLIPAVKALRAAFPNAVISADTYKGNAALAAAEAGADIINDVGGFGFDPAMLPCAVRSELPYVLSHIKGTPEHMQDAPAYDDLLGELHLYFREKIEEAERAGLPRERLILDPGLGFGKRAQDNLLILKEIESLGVFGRPILVGYSRKKFTGTLGDENEAGTWDARLTSATAISALVEGRVQLTRVHDVRENRRALLTAQAIREAF